MHNFLMFKKNSTENGLFKQLNNTGVPFATNCILNGLSIYIHMFSLPFFVLGISFPIRYIKTI